MIDNFTVYIEEDPIQIVELDDYVWYIDPYRVEVDVELKENGKIIYLTDAHDEDDKEFTMFAKHCVKGSAGAQIIDELDVRNGEDRIVEKTRFNGFFRTDLDKTLTEFAPDQVHVVGVCTSICVLATVIGLRDRYYDVFVHRDGVADFDPEAHMFSLQHLQKIFGVKVI